MVTKNYYRYLAYMFSNNTSISVKNYSGNNSAISRTDNYIHWTLLWGGSGDNDYTPRMKHIRTSLSGKPGVILGNGDTAPTSDDYKLAGEIITGFTYSGTLQQVVSDTAVTAKAIYTITNTSDTEITIKEIGLIGHAINGSSAQYKFLLERTVLDTPVTIPAGGIGQVEYTITFNLPTAT